MTEPFCNRRVPALQIMNITDVLINAVNDNIISEEPMEIPAGSTTRIQNRVVHFIPAFHDLINQVNVRGSYCFFYRIQIIQSWLLTSAKIAPICRTRSLALMLV